MIACFEGIADVADKIRKTCEIVMKILRAELTAEGRIDILQQVMAYRGGYSQEVCFLRWILTLN